MISTVTDGVGEVKYGDPIKKVFKLTDEQVKKVHYWSTGCSSCTTAVLNKKEKELEVVIDITKIGATEGELHMLHKTVDLYLDPEKPQFIADENSDIEAEMEKDYQKSQIKNAINKLSHDDKEFIMNFFGFTKTKPEWRSKKGKVTVSSIAQATGRSNAYIKKKLTRILKELSSYLK